MLTLLITARPRRSSPAFPSVLVALLSTAALPAAEVTLRGLIAEMTDLERLCSFPDPPYITRQASSYDRESRSPTQGEGWFANADQGKYIREETSASGRKEYVMMEAEGPGTVVRIWSPDPKGTIRIYLDGGAEPVLEAPMADLLSGKVKPFLPPLAGERSRGSNLHFPLAYRTRCKVTGDQSPFYYHVNYRTYPAGTAVESFSWEALKGIERELERVREALASPAKAAPRRRVKDQVVFAVGIPPGETRPLFRVEKGGAIRSLRLSVGKDGVDELLRKCILIGRFDGERRPSIWAPLGDFFGSAPGINPYLSLPMRVAPNGDLECRFVMPFEREARFEVRNLSAREVNARGIFETGAFAWSDRALRFHARFRVEHDMATRPMRDWTFIECSGKGVFVGSALSVANPVKAWWGEGDEKIYVDGETFPSHFGTGTEDYFGYGWCHNAPFQHAYHNQTRVDGPGNFGHTSVNRWHVIDDIPFTRSFRFDLELWHSNPSCKVSYAATSYWYARPEAADSAAEPQASELRVPALPELKLLRVEGAIEAEALAVKATAGTAGRQDLDLFDGSWSGSAHLWWRGAGPGDELKVEFSAPEARRYRVTAAMTKAADYGIHELSINGERAGDPIDLYNQGVIPSGPVELGVFALRQGQNELGVKVAGTNPAANPKGYMFGLDYLLVKPE